MLALNLCIFLGLEIWHYYLFVCVFFALEIWYYYLFVCVFCIWNLILLSICGFFCIGNLILLSICVCVFFCIGDRYYYVQLIYLCQYLPAIIDSTSSSNSSSKPCKTFIGLAYQGKDIMVFRFIIEYSSLRDFVP